MKDSLSKQLSSYVILLAVLLCSLVSHPPNITAQARSKQAIRVTMSFDNDWRFLKADADGAEKPVFGDSAWRNIDGPQDWSIEGAFDEKNPPGGAGGFLPAGIGLYRKHFILRRADARHRVFID